LVSSSSGTIPQPAPRALPTDPFAGIVDVNHPGGSCWVGVTPDIRVGDIIRTIAYNPNGTIRTVDQTRTANATVTRNGVEVTNASSSTAADGIVKVHGVAMNAQGNPLPLDQFEQRMIANKDAFVFNGRRTLRAGGAGKDGALTYDANDPTGTHWTATYSGLVQADIDRIMGLNGFPGAEFRALWLGSVPLAGLELTIYENDPNLIANGPTPPCVTPSEPFDTVAPPAPRLTAQQPNSSGQQNVILTWTGATDNVGIIGYGVYRDGTRIANVGPAVLSFTDHNVLPGLHTYAVDAVDAASPNGGLPSGQNLPWGNRSAQAGVTQVNDAQGNCLQGSASSCANQTPPGAQGFTITSNDTAPPTVPQNLIATVNLNTVSLTWAASTDDVGVVSYGVYRNNVKIA